jgi:hypothetical protein
MLTIKQRWKYKDRECMTQPAEDVDSMGPISIQCARLSCSHIDTIIATPKTKESLHHHKLPITIKTIKQYVLITETR